MSSTIPVQPDLRQGEEQVSDPRPRWDDAKLHAELAEMAASAKERMRRLNRTRRVSHFAAAVWLVGLVATKTWTKSKAR